jgi:hypothetical protein
MNLTPLEEKFLDACSDDDMDLIKELVPLIQNVNFERGNNTPLWHAVCNNNLALVDILIEKNAHINDANTIIDGIQSLDMLEKLIHYGLNIHYDEDSLESPLYFMVIYCDIVVAKKLIELGVKYQHLDFSENPQKNEEIKYFIEELEIKKEKKLLDQLIVYPNEIKNKNKL